MSAGKIISSIFAIAILGLWIVSIAGLVYLTKFSYESKEVPSEGNNFRGIKITGSQLTLAKITVTLQWINLGLTVILFLIGVGYNRGKKNSR
jgi:hypothetical protein